MWAKTWKAITTPKGLGRIVWLVGLMTLVSALVPAMRTRLHDVTSVLPAIFPAAATTGAAGLGVLLMLLARGLRRGKRPAWLVALVATAVIIVLHVVKGLDIEEALISTGMLALLLGGRKNFTAKSDPASPRRLLTVVILGPIVATCLGWLWLTLDDGGEAPGTTAWMRLQHAFLGLVGITGPVHYIDEREADIATVALAVLGLLLLIVAILTAFQPHGGPHPLKPEEEQRVREILAKWGKVDSLSYFATREDRSVLFSKSGKAAVSYRVVGGVSLAGGDPLGDPEAWPGAIEAWLAEAKGYGWAPAVLGASEQGATAYHRAGMDALELGDEAIVDVGTWSLEGRHMRVVRQAVSRCKRAGLVVSCYRADSLDEETWAGLRQLAEDWRDGPVERGFSMALNRFGDPRDRQSVVVIARDAEGNPHGILNFAPWGADGLSLDLMRRRRDTENGLIEYMVVELIAHCAELKVKRISLNFAVFRSVFARGERLGAGPIQRMWHAILLYLSRFWQIESLYRANAKYHPEWVPRFLCFASSSDLARVGIAALRAEAFIVAPQWVQRLAPKG